ncbi:hypothetical protein F5144DRAFT_600725 [Chaetomium tenue]|uniref:Uncharacterized protein n=1 Tax=Chaetomium tenue TaxID=1854479 RepID=A0ACB7PFY0_9PEZI|nr:hypothetical protein F5144DRAFT_600725 [Chaetomium globosum]
MTNISATGSLGALNQFIRAPRGRTHGSWGYTILRTGYSPESGVLFTVALERLKAKSTGGAIIAAASRRLGEVPGLEEKRQFLGTGAGAWVWPPETDCIADPEVEELDDNDEYRGWMRMDVYDIRSSWLRRLGCGRSGKRRWLGHEEREQASGIYWFAEY